MEGDRASCGKPESAGSINSDEPGAKLVASHNIPGDIRRSLPEAE